MPSLNELGEFKFSFANIGNEKADIEAKNGAYPDLPLPKNEAAPMDFPSRNPDQSFLDSSEAGASEMGGFDFGAFLNSLPVEDAPPPVLDDILSDDDSAFMEPGDSAASAESDDILSGFNMDGMDADGAEEIPAQDMPIEEPSQDESSAEETPFDDFNLDGLDLGGEEVMPGESSQEEPPAAGEPSLGEPSSSTGDFPADDFSLGESSLEEEFPLDEPIPPSGDDVSDSLGAFSEDSSADDFSLGDLSDIPQMSADDESSLEELHSEGIDMGGESPDTIHDTDEGDQFSGEDEVLPGNAFDGLDSLGTLDTPLEETSGGEGIDLGGEADDAGFNLDGEIGADASAEAPPVDFGDLGSDFASDMIELGGSEVPEHSAQDGGLDFIESGDMGSGDFALDGLEELFDKTKVETAAPPPKKGLFGGFRRKKPHVEEIPEAESDIEEIQLSEHDVERLLHTIESYPLNLRIVCEELIAEQVILPQQLSRLLRCLINGAHVRETAALVEEITGKPVIIPKSYEKMTGAAFEAEQASFAYIFVHNFLPVFRLFLVIAAFIASVAYLGYRFVYIPMKAEGLYKRGYERIPEGEYQRANELFDEAFVLHQKKKWFYLYAEAFRDQRRYSLAEEKYDQLLGLTDNLVKNNKGEPLKIYPRDKKGVLDYAYMNTYYLLNYEKASRLLHEQLLFYSPNDYEGLLAAGDNFLLWADSDPRRFYDKYEDARFSYARLLELRGWQVPIVERMLRHFIRTDNLKEVLYLRNWFESDKKRNLLPSSKAELAGYLLDKQLEEVKGVPDPYLEGISSVRTMLLEAIEESSPQLAKDKVIEPNIPEPHYHLARYHNILNNTHEERLALENARRAFKLAKTETVRRRQYRVDTQYRYSNLLVSAREFIPAEEQIVEGIELFEDYLGRNLISATASLPFSNIPQLGQLYAAKGDLEYFVKSGNMEEALAAYHTAENYGYAPPEIKYRMGAAYYQLEDWGKALDYLFTSSKDLPLNRRMLYALGNAAYRRNDYFAAQGYYSRLLDILENQRVRLPVLLPNDNEQFLELGERLMMAHNNMGVVYEALADQTGNREYRARAMSYYMQSANAWDSITRGASARNLLRDPESQNLGELERRMLRENMSRMSLVDTPGAPSVNQAYLNVQNAMRANSLYAPQIFPRIDKDVLEPSRWEELAGATGLQ